MTALVRDNPTERNHVSATIAMGRPAETCEVASPILYLLSDAASFVSGACLDASGGGFVIDRGRNGQ